MVARRTRGCSKGFTLIELMITSSILMVIMFSGYYAYSLYSQKWQKRVDLFWNSTREVVALESMIRSLDAISTYVANDENGKKTVVFFADDSSMRYVTYSPIFSTTSALIELSIESNGITYNLVYKEKPLEKSPLFTLESSLEDHAWTKEIVVLDNLTSIQWEFYGWVDYREATNESGVVERNDDKDSRKVYKIHEPKVIRILPQSIEVTFSRNGNESRFITYLPRNSTYRLISTIRNDA